MNKIHKKLIVFDTDGVIFRSQFLLQLSYYSSFFYYLRAFLLCFLFSINSVPIRRLLEKIYTSLEGMSEEDFWKVYYKMKLVDNAGEAICCIRERGHSVALISSGVPDFLMKHLARRLQADYGYGIDAEFEKNIFTGKVSGFLSSYEGKTKLTEQLLQENEISWEDAIVIGDDRNNLDLMSHAKTSVGFNSNYQVRKKAKYVTDSCDLKKVLPYIDIEENPSFIELSKNISHGFTYSWMQEFRRKAVHVCAAFIPLFVSIHYPSTLYLLMSVTLLFVMSEWMRLNGVSLPLVNLVTRFCIRSNEQRRFTVSPVTLSSGVLFSLILFPKPIACTVIFIVAFSDSLATLAGRFYGRHRIPYNQRKSLEGSIAFFLSAFICSILYVPFYIALITAFVSCIIESLPIKGDNLSIPLGTGLFLVFITH